MKRCIQVFPRCALLVVAASLIFATPALAGPPLICHSINIGTASSLPWPVNGGNVVGRSDYDVSHLVADTLSLLGPNTDVLVRMETLRRATIYAQRNSAVAKELVLKLYERTTANSQDALAAFDFGYLVECYKQAHLAHTESLSAWDHGEWSNPAADVDGYGFVKAAISRRGNDPEMEFAAALISSSASRKECQQHIQRAVAGAKADALLADNLSSGFGKEMVERAAARDENK